MATSALHDEDRQSSEESDRQLNHRDLMVLADCIDGRFMIGLGIYLGFTPRELDAIKSTFSSKRIGILELLFLWRGRQSPTKNTRLALSEKLHVAGLHTQADILNTSKETQDKKGDTLLTQPMRNISPTHENIDDIIKSIVRSKMSGLMKTLLEQLHAMPAVEKLRVKSRILLFLDDALEKYDEDHQYLADIETTARYKLQDVHESLAKLTPNDSIQTSADIGFTNYIQTILARITNASDQEDLSWDIVAMTGDDSDETLDPPGQHEDSQFDELPSGRYVKKELRSTDMLAQYVHMQWEFIRYHQLMALEYDEAPTNKYKESMFRDVATGGLGETGAICISQVDEESVMSQGHGEMSDKNLFIVWRQRCKCHRTYMAEMYDSFHKLSKNSERHEELCRSHDHVDVDQDLTETEFLSKGVDYIARQRREMRVLRLRITNLEEKLNPSRGVLAKKDEKIESMQKEKKDLLSYIHDLEKDPDAVRQKLVQEKDDEIERLTQELENHSRLQDPVRAARSETKLKPKSEPQSIKRRLNNTIASMRSSKSM